ncbi:MAG: hypothetical protein ACK5X3_12970 [Pseudomonadota bacterium]
MKATNLLEQRRLEQAKIAPPVVPKPKPPAKPRPAPTNARAIVKPTPGHMGVVWPAHPRRAAKEPAVSEEVSRNINALFDCWCVHLCISRGFVLDLDESKMPESSREACRRTLWCALLEMGCEEVKIAGTFRVYRNEIRNTAYHFRHGTGWWQYNNQGRQGCSKNSSVDSTDQPEQARPKASTTSRSRSNPGTRAVGLPMG